MSSTDVWLKYYKSSKGYLMHHGIKGQKWGVRNGPPYPLKKQQKSGSLKLDLQFFGNKKKAKDRPYKFKTKEEYARVMKALSSYQLSKEDMLKDTIFVDVEVTDNKNKVKGAYTYFAKNQDGHGAFQVFNRKKIKDSATGMLRRKNDE